MEPMIEISGRNIGHGHPTYIIAEMSANHHQDSDEAVRIIRAARKCGADAVKLQHYAAYPGHGDQPVRSHGDHPSESSDAGIFLIAYW